jgi:hypothetical protein
LKFRKKYTKSLQIVHNYGEDEVDDKEELDEESARVITESAIAAGTAPQFNMPSDVVTPPVGAAVDIGGKKCKWCGSTSHCRKSHKDCHPQ